MAQAQKRRPASNWAPVEAPPAKPPTFVDRLIDAITRHRSALRRLGVAASLTVVAGITFWLGMGLVVGAGFLSASDPIADIDHFHPLANRLIGLGAIAALIVYFVWITRMRWRRAAVVGNFKLPGPRLTLGQMALGVIDICSASAALYVLLPQDK